MGALYGRYELLDRLRAYKVRPADDVPPHKFETGTKNHEGLAGTTAAINYLADLGAEVIRIEPAPQGDHTRRPSATGACRPA